MNIGGVGNLSSSSSLKIQNERLKEENIKLKEELDNAKLQIESLMKTNNRLLIENGELMEKNRKLGEQVDDLQNRSSILSRSFVSEQNKELAEAKKLSEIYRLNADNFREKVEE